MGTWGLCTTLHLAKFNIHAKCKQDCSMNSKVMCLTESYMTFDPKLWPCPKRLEPGVLAGHSLSLRLTFNKIAQHMSKLYARHAQTWTLIPNADLDLWYVLCVWHSISLRLTFMPDTNKIAQFMSKLWSTPIRMDAHTKGCTQALMHTHKLNRFCDN
jgi:hypothetical protein